MGHVTRFLPYSHFLCNNPRPHGMIYRVDLFGKKINSSKKGLSGPKFLQFTNKKFPKICSTIFFAFVKI